ncbi:hypothetical protein [Paenibacillus alba]|uniref:hypothetical protein n=1 Tax=Paenibacillus alba TaxID=1197127 RepID=UPI001564CBCC|nr:hypothetical protein [Paenibacillus alba]
MIKFYNERVEFSEYPFWASSISNDGIILIEEICEVLLDQLPPEIRTKAGDVIFVEALYKERLKKFAEINNIPMVRRIDTWGLILDEFLDTEFSEDSKERVFNMLEACGISREEVVSIRHSVHDVMIAYNFTSMLWEWVHLGLYDLLKAHSGVLTGDKYKLDKEDFKELYKNAVNIANKGILMQ